MESRGLGSVYSGLRTQHSGLNGLRFAAMLHIVFVAVFALLVTIPCGLAVTAVALVKSTSPMIDRIIRFWARNLVRAAGIDLQTEGLERLDPDRRYILVANHYSYFDIPCILASVPQPIRFMAKASLFKIPIFGGAIGRAGFIPIDRKNRRTAVKSFDLATKRIQQGNTIVIFPEEGRTSKRTLKPFQRGAFLLALRARLPIVPIAIDGTHDVFPVGAKKITPGRVTIRVSTPIEPSEFTVREKDALSMRARREIVTMLGIEDPQPAAAAPAPEGEGDSES
jgi:1-acyl-sn-glycerol-3-phosphate acyltransferase